MIGDIGVILLLFTIGLEFSFEKLLRSWRVVIIGGMVQVCTTIVAITAVTVYFGFTFGEALMFGFIVSLSSTAIVMKILQERGEADSLQGRTLLGILIFQDLAIIPMIMITPLLVGSSGPDLGRLPFQFLKVSAIVLIIVVMARWIIPGLLHRVAAEKSRELFFFTIAGICIIITWLTGEAGLSFTLGAFFAGLMIGESDYNIDALGHIIPFRDVFASVFFLSIGMLLDTRVVLDHLNYVIMIVAVISGVKIMTGGAAAAVLGMQRRTCIFTALSLCQIGEFSFVLAKNGLETNLIPANTYQLFLAGAIITMALTPFSMNAAPGVSDVTYRLLPGRPGRKEEETAERKAHPLSDHIVIAGYGMTGKSVARAAEITGIPYTVIELNPDIIRKRKESGRSPFVFGDAVQAEVLEHAGIRDAQALVVVVSEEEAVPRIIRQARHLSPNLYIIARTRQIRTTRQLLDRGADEVISEEFETSVEIFSRILSRYGLPDEEIVKIKSRLRKKGRSYFVKSSLPEARVNDTSPRDFDSMYVQQFVVQPGSAASGKTLGDLGLSSRYRIMEFALKRGERTIAHPPADTRLIEGDILLVFGTDESTVQIQELFAR
jgi:CPA2 family monovalent cation:H+ antiporter-2